MKKSTKSTTSQKGTVCPFEESTQLNALCESILAESEPLEITIPPAKSELISSIVSDLNGIGQRFVAIGFKLLYLKSQGNHGEFKRDLEAIGIGNTTAKNAMKLAGFLQQVPAKQRAKLIQERPRKVLPLARLGTDLFASSVDSGEIDLEDISLKTVKEVETVCRQIKRDHDKQSDRISNLEAALADSKGAAAWEEHTREVFAAITEKVGVAANQCESITAAMRGWRQTPTKAPGRPGVHGRRVNSHTARLLDLAESLRAQADAVVEAAEETRARIGYDDE